MMRVLLVNGHQRYEGFAEGRLNQTIADAAEGQLTAAGHDTGRLDAIRNESRRLGLSLDCL